MAKTKSLVQRRRCRFHPEQVAAVCPDCFDAAERQQEEQLVKERRKAHREYLSRGA